MLSKRPGMSESGYPMDMDMVDECLIEVRKHGPTHVEGLECMASMDKSDSFLSDERVDFKMMRSTTRIDHQRRVHLPKHSTESKVSV